MCLRELSKRFLNSGRLGAMTTTLRNLPQYPTILQVQILFLTPSLNQACHSFKSFPQVLKRLFQVSEMKFQPARPDSH